MPLADDVRQEIAGLVQQSLAAVLGEDGPLGKRLAGQSAAIEELRKGKAKGEPHGEPSEVTAAIRQAEAKGEEALRRLKEAEDKSIETAILSTLQDVHGLTRVQARMATDHLLRHRGQQFVTDGPDVVYVAEDKTTRLPLSDYAQKLWAPQYLHEFVPPKRGAGLRRSGDKGSPGKVLLTIKQVAEGEVQKRGLKPGDFEISEEE